MKSGKFFTNEEKLLVTNAIKAAELNTSGEIRVHIESVIKADALDRAAYLFEVLEMHKTKDRNGVLFYLAQKSRKFAILGDSGINAKVPRDFWDKIKEKMTDRFSEGLFALGLSEGIQMAGEQLKIHFSFQKDDVNELSDEISFGK